MAVYIKESYYGLVLDTNLYTGNFERQLTAYCTGHVGECEVGKELVSLFEEDLGIGEDERATEEDPFWDALAHIPDENGCARPVSLWYQSSESLIIFFNEKPTKEQVEIIVERAKRYAGDERIAKANKWDAQPDLQILKARIVHIRTTVEVVEL